MSRGRSSALEPESTNPSAEQDRDEPYGNYARTRYCDRTRVGQLCIAVLSVSHHECTILSQIDQRTLKRQTAERHESHTSDCGGTPIEARVMARHAYCKLHKCDVIIDYNDYHAKLEMQLTVNAKEGPMPPHWKKVAALRRWLPHYDAVLLLDMDMIVVEWSFSVYELLAGITGDQGALFPAMFSGFVLCKASRWGFRLVDAWWWYGTAPGCRCVRLLFHITFI